MRSVVMGPCEDRYNEDGDEEVEEVEVGMNWNLASIVLS